MSSGFVTVVSTVVVACGGSAPSEKIGTCPGRTDAADSIDAGYCAGPLAEVDMYGGMCPLTYEAAMSLSAECSQGLGPTVALGRTGDSCGDIAYFLYSRSQGTYAKQCFYDLQTKNLVGALYCADMPIFCSASSSTLRYGGTTRKCLLPKILDVYRSCDVDTGP